MCIRDRSIAVRYRQSARGASNCYRDAINNGILGEEILKPVHFTNQGGHAPYRNVLPARTLASQIDAVAAATAEQLPLADLESARDFLKDRLVASTRGESRHTNFSAGEVAKDLWHLRRVKNGERAPMEAGAVKGLALAKRFFPPGHGAKPSWQTVLVSQRRRQRSFVANSLNMSKFAGPLAQAL